MTTEFDTLYSEKKTLYERALRHVEQCIRDIAKDYASDRLFRVCRVETRLKSLPSLKFKAYERSIPLDEMVFEVITDIAGARIVVNNLIDIGKIVDKIKESTRLRYDPDSVEDKIAEPPESGYRGVHFIVYSDIEYKGTTHTIPCEVQVHTLFQNSWATLAHDDIYKNTEAMPPIVKKLSSRLAEQLAVMDKLAQDIRDELAKEVQPVAGISDEDPLSKQAIGVIYYELFGEKPLVYDLQVAQSKFEEIGLSTVADLKKQLPSPTVKGKLDTLHRKLFGDWPIDRMDLMVWGVKVMVQGDPAYRDFADMVREQWEEIEALGRREALFDLPDTIEELMQKLEEKDISEGFFSALKELGGIIPCDMCGEDICDLELSHEVLCEHYDVDCPELADFLGIIQVDGMYECEDDDHPGLCHHCAHLLYDDNT